MTIKFYLSYTAAYDDEILLHIVINDDTKRKISPLAMTTFDGQTWTCHVNNVNPKSYPHIDYFFTVSNARQEKKREWNVIKHRIDIDKTHASTIHVYNIWHDKPLQPQLYSAAYTECPARQRHSACQHHPYERIMRIVARAPQIEDDESLALALNNNTDIWDTANVVNMTLHNTCEWTADINADDIDDYTFCRFAINHADGSRTWENMPHRKILPIDNKPGELIVYEVGEADFGRRPRPLSTILTTMKKLRSETSCGIGDFGDLANLIQQTALSATADVITISPINDTTSTHTAADATPYSAISAFALHPIHADLRNLPQSEDPKQREHAEQVRISLNTDPEPDYQATFNAKIQRLHQAFDIDGDQVMHSSVYRRFLATNEHWLVPYAQYSYLRDAYNISDFRQWPNHNEWIEAERGQLASPRTKAYKKLAFYYYVQFVLHQQLCAAHQLARQLGIVLKGDLTANINPNGCDVWQMGNLTDSDEWWERRLSTMEHYFDACLLTESTRRRRRIVESTRMLIE